MQNFSFIEERFRRGKGYQRLISSQRVTTKRYREVVAILARLLWVWFAFVKFKGPFCRSFPFIYMCSSKDKSNGNGGCRRMQTITPEEPGKSGEVNSFHSEIKGGDYESGSALQTGSIRKITTSSIEYKIELGRWTHQRLYSRPRRRQDIADHPRH